MQLINWSFQVQEKIYWSFWETKKRAFNSRAVVYSRLWYMGLPLINWSFWEQKNDVIYFVTQTKNNPGGSYFDQRHPK